MGDLTPFDSTGLAGIIGLHNGGNLCYMNSLIQALLSCPAFNTRVQDIGKSSLAKFYAQLFRESRRPSSPMAIHSVAKLLVLLRGARSGQNNLSAGRQEDAHEGLVFLLESMGPGIDSVFHVRHQVKICCRQCGTKINGDGASRPPSEIMITLFDDNAVNDPQKYITCHNQRLPDYRCEKCHVRGQCTKVTSLTRLSEIILVVFNKYDKKEVKEFPPSLIFNSIYGPFHYQVVAQVEHHGNVHGGHYTAKCMRQKPKAFHARIGGTKYGVFTFDDQGVTYSSGGFQCTLNTYLVFYHLFKKGV